MLDDNEAMATCGVDVAHTGDMIDPYDALERRYAQDRATCDVLARFAQTDDRILEIGSGVGICSTVASQRAGIGQVTTVEANPVLIEIVDETHRRNDAGPVELLHAVVTVRTAERVPYFLRADFSASSAQASDAPYDHAYEVPAIHLDQLLGHTGATALIYDGRQVELDLFAESDLSGLRLFVLTDPGDAMDSDDLCLFERLLADQGLTPVPGSGSAGLRLYQRSEGLPDMAGATTSSGDWPPADPRVLVATCMRNEGPFILEWVAWHKALGVTDIVVFTDHCTDGTDRMLERLDELGLVMHLPIQEDDLELRDFREAAFSILPELHVFEQADFFLAIDVDEFINVRVGDGTLGSLFNASGAFDVLSLSELTHGCNGHLKFEPGWVTELFPGHQSERPGKKKAVRAVRSLTCLSNRITALGYRRPFVEDDCDDVTWLNGSGQALPHLLADEDAEEIDCRDSYDLVSLDHYPLRSLESYVARMSRWKLEGPQDEGPNQYWRKRNRNEKTSSRLDLNKPVARALYDRLLQDPTLAILQEAVCAAHRQDIETLWDQPVYADKREWILEYAWEHARRPAAKSEPGGPEQAP